MRVLAVSGEPALLCGFKPGFASLADSFTPVPWCSSPGAT